MYLTAEQTMRWPISVFMQVCQQNYTTFSINTVPLGHKYYMTILKT